MKKTRSFETQSLREFAEVLRGRRTVDQYLQTSVPDELIREALEAATWAPNHYVSEPWRFILPGKKTIGRIIDLCSDIAAAKKGQELADHKRKSWGGKPGWLIVTCPHSDDDLREQEDYAACCAAVQNFMLYLWKAGVGSKWTTGPITRDSRFFEVIGVDESEAFVVGMLWFGYPKVTPTQSRGPLNDVLSELP